MTERVAVMEGPMDDIDLSGVLHVVGIGRQYTGIEFSAGSKPVGTVFIKSGKVVNAITPVSSGRQALFELFERPPTFFHVYRTPTPGDLPEPLGTVGGLVTEATRHLQTKSAQSRSPVSSASESAPPSRRDLAPQKPRGAVSSAPPSTGSAASGPVRAVAPGFMSSSAAPGSVSSSAAPGSMSSSAAPGPFRATAGTSTSSAPPPVRRTTPAPAMRESTRSAAPRVSQRAARTVKGSSGAILAVASPKGGCGKTTISLNLAISLAKQKHRVILVDTDINGDVLSWINAREQAEHGAYDAVLGRTEAAALLLPTILPELEILPAVGQRLPTPAELRADLSGSWRRLLTGLRSRADIVLVDTPAGMYGTTHEILSVSTHVLGVLQAEAVAQRSFTMFQQCINSLTGPKPVQVAGVVLNMLNAYDGHSLSVLQQACAQLPEQWLFETSIPRNIAFSEASGDGLPVRLMDDTSPPAVSWLFDTLAAEVVQRLNLKAPSRTRPKSLLM